MANREFVITDPDGRRFKITVPEGGTEEDAWRYFESQPRKDKPSIDTSELSRLTTDFDKPSFGGAAARGALDISQGGFSDELAGLAEASGLPRGTPTWLTAPVGGARMYFGDQGAKERYEKMRNAARTQQELDVEHRLGARMLGQVGAGAVQSLAGAAALPARALAVTAAARAAPEASLLARMGQQAIIGSTTGGIHGYGSGEEGGRGESAGWGAGLGGVLGVAGEGLATGAGNMIRRYFGGAKPRPGVDTAAAMRESDEFGYPLYRGEVTGDLRQQAWEQSARHGSQGGKAQEMIQNQDAVRDAARQAAQQRMGPTTPAQAAEEVSGAMQRAAAGFREGADDLYASARAKGANIEAGAVSVLANRVERDLAADGLPLNQIATSAYPHANQAMNILRGVSGFRGSGAQTAEQALNQRAQQAMSGLQGFSGPPTGGTKVVASSLDTIDEARKAIVRLRGAHDADRHALGIIKNSLDNWLDDAINARLFSGDASALDDLLQARDLWSRYKQITTARPGDDASAMMAKITAGDHTVDEVANWLVNTSNVGLVGRASRLAATIKKTIGDSAPEWQSLQEAVAHKILNPTIGQGGPQALATSIRKNIDGSLAKIVLPVERREELRRFGSLMGRTVPDPRATNPSKTGYELKRQLGQLLPTIAAAGGVGYGYSSDNPLAYLAAVPAALQAGKITKARAALNPLPSRAGLALERGAARVPMSLTGTGPSVLPGLYRKREDQDRPFDGRPR